MVLDASCNCGFLRLWDPTWVVAPTYSYRNSFSFFNWKSWQFHFHISQHKWKFHFLKPHFCPPKLFLLIGKESGSSLSCCKKTQSHSTMVSWWSRTGEQVTQNCSEEASPLSLAGRSGYHHGTGRRFYWGPRYHWHIGSHGWLHSKGRYHWHQPRGGGPIADIMGGPPIWSSGNIPRWGGPGRLRAGGWGDRIVVAAGGGAENGVGDSSSCWNTAVGSPSISNSSLSCFLHVSYNCSVSFS